MNPFVCVQTTAMDEECMSVMMTRYCIGHSEMTRLIREWQFDYLTATYLLVLKRKMVGRQWRSQEKRLGMAKILGSDIDNSRCVKRGFLGVSINLWIN